MESTVSLSDSNLCRLCGEENNNGNSLYLSDENSVDLGTLVNFYLPLKVEEGDQYPKTICPGCHIQLESTKLFMDLIIEGQAKLKQLLKSQKDLAQVESERQKLEQALQNHNRNASVETYTVQGDDENGEKYIVQIYSDGPLFSEDHQLHLRAGGLNKEKKKRGRPRKGSSHVDDDVIPEQAKNDIPVTFVTGRHKRHIRPPARYTGTFQEKEFTQMLINEEAIEECQTDEDKDGENLKSAFGGNHSNKVIGKLVTDLNGPQVEQELLVFNRRKTRNKNKIFNCKYCSRKFRLRRWCELHEKTHVKNSHHTSRDCLPDDGVVENPIESPKRVELDEVDKLDENELSANTLKCDECKSTFSCMQNLNVHIKAVHKGERAFSCNKCDRTFAYSSTLKNHMATHGSTRTKMLTCSFCGKKYRFSSSLAYHIDVTHRRKTYVCFKCNQTFTHRQLLQRHQTVHAKGKPFKCDVCNKMFKTKQTLAAHCEVHMEKNKVVCFICGKELPNKKSMTMHLKLHSTKAKQFECEVCKKTFLQKGNLNEHKRIHTGEKPYPCNLCGVRFTTSSQCKVHMRRHTGERPYACPYCPKKFSVKKTYNIHIRRHLGLTPYWCKHCPKEFPDNTSLARHERIHSSAIIKQYQCEDCDRSFSDRSNYKKHCKTHLKKKIVGNGSAPEGLQIEPLATDNESSTDVANVIEDEDSVVEPSNGSKLESMDENVSSENPTVLQIQLLDEEGNTISLTTTNGDDIPLVSTGDENFKGLLPDGTLLSFDIISDDKVPDETSDTLTIAEACLVDLSERRTASTATPAGVQFAMENSINGTEEKPAFLSDHGKTSFISAFDENSFLN